VTPNLPSITLRGVYNKLSPNEPIRYYFLDDNLNLLYAKEDRQVNLISFFSLLSLVISVLGILGLSIFTSQYRTKEIGIRKINGATITEIVTLLNKGFIKWIVIAFVIATPLAYYTMTKMARKLRLQNRPQLVDICFGRIRGTCRGVTNR